MKIPSLFSKTPQHRKFSYTPRFYDPQEEERREREERIRKELRQREDSQKREPDDEDLTAYRSRIAGSFRSAKRTASRQSDPSASLMRLIIFLFLAIWLIAYLQFGSAAFFGLLLFVPFYFYLKLKNVRRDDP